MSEEELDQSQSETETEETGDSSQEEQASSGADDQQSESGEKDFKTLYENQKKRAEKAEEQLKKVKSATTEEEGSDDESQSSQKQDSQHINNQSEEELRIIARRGYDEEQMEKLRKVAQVEGVSLAEAENSDIFTTWQKNREQQQKAEQAQVGGSTGSGRQTQQKDIKTPNLSEDEHRKLWEQKLGR